MIRTAPIALLGVAMLLPGCVGMPRTSPVDVSRFHLGQPVERASFTIQPLSSDSQISPEYQIYADAVGAEMEEMGFARQQGTPDSTYVVSVAFARASAGTVRSLPPITIGAGGGGNYVGGGASIGLGARTHQMLVTELAVQIVRRADNNVLWEGRAQVTGAAAAEDMQSYPIASRLSNALFRGFPGESGITITVR